MAKDSIGKEVLASVNWEATDIAMKESKQSRHVFVSTPYAQCRKVHETVKLREDIKCPRCREI